MGTLQVSNISLAYGDRDLLNEVSFNLFDGSKAALAGPNGSGKSTLLKIISGIISSDSGQITKSKDLQISYLPQGDIVYKDATLYEEVEKSFYRYEKIVEEISSIEATLATKNEDDSTAGLLESLHEKQELLIQSGYYFRQAKIEQILKGLGFKSSDKTKRCETFSGGWQMRIALAKILIENNDVMLLDEPTNYLDLESRIWLRNYLNQTTKAFMIVSHDQDFLDETVDEVYELFNGKLNRYSGNYSSYVKQREQELEQLEKEFKSQQKEIEKSEQFIERFRYKATKARQVQSRIKQLDKIEHVQVPSHLRKLNFSFPDPPHSGKEVVKVTNLSKSYGSLNLFNNFSFYLNRGDRLAVTGRNGVGKTTLLRLLGGQDHSFSGSIELGTNVKLGYFAQEVKPTFDINNTVLEELESSALTADLPRLRTLLGSFLFSDDDVDKKVGVLSGGEMSRLALLKILLHPANLLILDEPTNHLDINAKQVLSEALKKYKGTVVFVSHDNHFIKSMANRILYLSDEGPTFYEGDFDYFSWKLEEQEAINTPQTARETVIRNNNQLAYKEANRLRNRIQSLKGDSKNLLEKIDKTQKAIEEVVTLMALEENYSDSDKIVSLVNKKEELDNKELSLEEKWFSIQKELEELENVLT